MHCDFYRDEVPFSATVILQRGPNGVRLDFFDPLRIKMTQVGNNFVQLAKDTSAPFAWTLNSEEAGSTPVALRGFIFPRQSTDDEVFMLEPYQPGKITVVFVHGLLSDALAFVNVANQLSADPEFVRRHQIWYVQYSTGDDFPRSAADLRQELQRAVSSCAPVGTDPAICHTVLIGHSMGGLLCRLLVTRSCGDVWRACSRKPLNEI